MVLALSDSVYDVNEEQQGCDQAEQQPAKYAREQSRRFDQLLEFQVASQQRDLHQRMVVWFLWARMRRNGVLVRIVEVNVLPVVENVRFRTDRSCWCFHLWLRQRFNDIRHQKNRWTRTSGAGSSCSSTSRTCCCCCCSCCCFGC